MTDAMTTPNPPELLPVEQVDRQGMVDLENARSIRLTPEFAAGVLAGKYDGDYRVQAFSRHRLSERERAAGMLSVDAVARALYATRKHHTAQPRRQEYDELDEVSKLMIADHARDFIDHLSATAIRTDTAWSDGVIPPDVRRLVIAARRVAFEDRSDLGIGDPAITELDAASEAFADRVPWEGDPAPPRTGED